MSTPPEKRHDLQRLTPRQTHVLELRLAGHSWRTIALALGIHEATARGHHKAAVRTLAQQHPPAPTNQEPPHQ